MPLRERPEEWQEPGLGSADAAGALHGLDDDHRQVAFASPEGGFDAVGIAPWQLDDEPRHHLRDAVRSGHDAVVGAMV